MTDMFTLEELATKLQEPVLENDIGIQARADAQAAIRRWTRQELTTTTWTNVVLPMRIDKRYGRVIDLPQRPVQSVAAVAVNGAALAPQAWGLDVVKNRIAVLAYIRPLHIGLSDQATVTYTAGYDVLPDEIKQIALSCAVRLMRNPESLVSQTTTASLYTESKTYAATHGAQAETPTLLLVSEMEQLRDYRRSVGSTVLR